VWNSQCGRLNSDCNRFSAKQEEGRSQERPSPEITYCTVEQSAFYLEPPVEVMPPPPPDPGVAVVDLVLGFVFSGSPQPTIVPNPKHKSNANVSNFFIS
jgi:hypothetical protein